MRPQNPGVQPSWVAGPLRHYLAASSRSVSVRSRGNTWKRGSRTSQFSGPRGRTLAACQLGGLWLVLTFYSRPDENNSQTAPDRMACRLWRTPSTSPLPLRNL